MGGHARVSPLMYAAPHSLGAARCRMMPWNGPGGNGDQPADARDFGLSGSRRDAAATWISVARPLQGILDIVFVYNIHAYRSALSRDAPMKRTAIAAVLTLALLAIVMSWVIDTVAPSAD